MTTFFQQNTCINAVKIHMKIPTLNLIKKLDTDGWLMGNNIQFAPMYVLTQLSIYTVYLPILVDLMYKSNSILS